MRRRPASLLAIFITVFVDLLAFGLVIPDLQLRGNKLGAHGLTLGLLLGSFSLAQLLTAPVLGRLSDRIGRRGVLLVTTALAAASFVFYAHATHLAWVLAARVLSGIAGGNLGVAFAYVADVTKPEERARGMGLIGAAFGLGFILGPPLGALLVRAGGGGPLLLGYTAAGLGLLNFLYVFFWLPEPERHEATAGSLVANMRRAFASPSLAVLLLMSFATSLGFTNLESTYFQLLAHGSWTFAPQVRGDMLEAERIGAYILGYVGVIAGFMQGYFIRKVTPRFGEVRLLRFAYLLQLPALALVPFASLWAPHLLVLLALGVANGLLQPSLGSLISRNAPREFQGSVFGVTQALGAFARFVGPMISNTTFQLQPYYPYLIGAAVILFPAFAAWSVQAPQQEGGQAETAVAH